MLFFYWIYILLHSFSNMKFYIIVKYININMIIIDYIGALSNNFYKKCIQANEYN